MIQSHPNWLFVSLFYDVESGLRRSGRIGLDKMLKKAAEFEITLRGMLAQDESSKAQRSFNLTLISQTLQQKQ